MFRVAVRDGLRADNPVERVKRPSAGKGQPRALTVADVRRIIEAAHGHRWGTAVVLAAR